MFRLPCSHNDKKTEEIKYNIRMIPKCNINIIEKGDTIEILKIQGDTLNA
jgi:hypothetical protein